MSSLLEARAKLTETSNPTHHLRFDLRVQVPPATSDLCRPAKTWLVASKWKWCTMDPTFKKNVCSYSQFHLILLPICCKYSSLRLIFTNKWMELQRYHIRIQKHHFFRCFWAASSSHNKTAQKAPEKQKGCYPKMATSHYLEEPQGIWGVSDYLHTLILQQVHPTVRLSASRQGARHGVRIWGGTGADEKRGTWSFV